MNNEFFNHKKTDAIKWIVTFALISVLIIGMIASLVIGINNGKTMGTPPKQTESGMVVTPDETNNAVKLAVTPLAADNNASPQAEKSYTITATILPASALQKANWSVAWKTPASSWATGKTVTDYVTVTPSEENLLTATLSCIKSFSEQIILTASATANTDKTATCTVDYQQRLVVNSLSLGGTALSTDTGNFIARISKTYTTDLDYFFSDGTIPYLGKGSDGYSEFIAGGLVFTDEFIAAYNANRGSLSELKRKMTRANLSTDVVHARQFEFTDGAYGGTVFYELLGYFNDANMAVLRTAVNSVGEGNVFKIGVFKTTSALDTSYVECDTWYKVGLAKDSVYMATESIGVDNSGFVF